MKHRSLRFKMIMGGVLAVMVPLLTVGSLAIYQARNALEKVTMAQSTEISKGLANMANLALEEEMKIVTQVADREVVIQGATKYAQGDRTGPEISRMAEAMRELSKKLGGYYESFFVIGLDGKVITTSGTVLDFTDRDYFQAAKAGKVNVGAVVKSKRSGNNILTFGAPVYSKSNQIIGVVGLTINISFLADKIVTTKLGKTGYAYVIDKTGLCIAHPKKEIILKVNATQAEGMKGYAEHMVAGETGAQTYMFKGVKKVAGFAPVPLTGWSICATQDYSELMAPASQLTLIIAIIGVILLAVTVLGVFFFSRGIAAPIGHIANDLDDISEQVAAASSQVASASQSLAEGSSEQASALEETSSSLEEMASMTRQNADNAAQAKGLMSEARKIVENVDIQMQKMVTAIHEVTQSSEETGKIIKTIDEIAFQTNLLALNAAVEAARAGEAGAGFAVVADEVRNLAMRAAEAARNTSSLIENTIVTVKNSRELTRQTRDSFQENMEITGKVSQLVDEIAAASSEQAQGIGQIGKAVSEMDKVVQQESASAEESASASEELNAQAMQMKGHVEKLVAIIDGGGIGRGSQTPRQYIGSEEKLVFDDGRSGVKKLLTAESNA